MKITNHKLFYRTLFFRLPPKLLFMLRIAIAAIRYNCCSETYYIHIILKYTRMCLDNFKLLRLKFLTYFINSRLQKKGFHWNFNWSKWNHFPANRKINLFVLSNIFLNSFALLMNFWPLWYNLQIIKFLLSSFIFTITFTSAVVTHFEIRKYKITAFLLYKR